MRFSEKDLQHLAEKGITKVKVVDQVNTFKEGIPFVKLETAAIVGERSEKRRVGKEGRSRGSPYH